MNVDFHGITSSKISSMIDAAMKHLSKGRLLRSIKYEFVFTFGLVASPSPIIRKQSTSSHPRHIALGEV